MTFKGTEAAAAAIGIDKRTFHKIADKLGIVPVSVQRGGDPTRLSRFRTKDMWTEAMIAKVKEHIPHYGRKLKAAKCS